MEKITLGPENQKQAPLLTQLLKGKITTAEGVASLFRPTPIPLASFLCEYS